MNINRRVLRTLLLVGTLTLFWSSMLTFGGIFATEYKMWSMNEQLGSSTRERVTDLISGREKEHLRELVHEKVELMDSFLRNIAWDTEIISNTATDILSNPQNYLPKEMIRPKSLEEGWLLSLILKPSEVDNMENLREEIALAANTQSVLKNIALSYKINCSVYATFEDGFGLLLDTDEKDIRNYSINHPKGYFAINFFERPWYKNAKEQKRTVFSDTFLNAAVANDLPVIFCSAPINVDGNFVGVAGIGFLVEDIAQGAFSSSIEDIGFCFLMNDDGQVIVSQKVGGDLSVKTGFPDLRKSSEKSLAQAAEKMTRGEKGLMTVTVDGTEYFLAFEPLQNVKWSFGAMIKVEYATSSSEVVATLINMRTENFINRMKNFSLILLPLIAVVFAILFAAVSVFGRRMTKSLVKPIRELEEGVREISSGNLDKKLEIHTGDEIEHLAVCFNAMTAELKTYILNLERETAERERISTELNVATNIQQSMLPHNFPRRADFEIFATMNAAKEVGGDFYDFYLLDENHLVVTIADVSGKGVPAALFMAISKTILQNFALSMNTPDDFSAVMTLANQQLCHDNDEMLFVTVFMGMLDLKTGEFVYVNAGHNPPLVYRDNKFEFLDVGKSCMLGIDEDVPFAQKKITLAAGDMIFLYTDGVTEAMNEVGEQFLPENLREFLNRENKSEPLETLLENVHRAVKKHAGNAEQSDDITMLALRRSIL